MTTHGIIIFDGICNVCSRLVQFLIKRDPNAYFRFASMQSETGKKLIGACGMPPDLAETIVLIEKTGCLNKSDAVIAIANRLTGFWPVGNFLKLIPRPIRDVVYSVVARNRYKWFGRRSACKLPAKYNRERFMN